MADKRIALLKRANKLFRQGKTEAAVKEYMKILVIKPDDLEVRRIVGDLQIRQGNTREAVEQTEWIAEHYLKEGFFAKAIAMYKRITRIDPENEDALLILADLYTKQGLIMEAKQIYLDIAEKCKRQNNQKKALEMYKKILGFDRGNIKMRTLLADNYLKEGMEDTAVEEYIATADILLDKKDGSAAEKVLVQSIAKIKSPDLIEKLLDFYTEQNHDEKAIHLLTGLGDELFKNTRLQRTLGELYLKNSFINEAVRIFMKLIETDPKIIDTIMQWGKTYQQRKEHDKSFRLFTPFVDKNIKNGQFEEAASLMRFIIADDNSYLPALTKLAAIFKMSGKTNNLIALYETMIPIYEKKGMKDQVIEVLEELIQLSDFPFSYEEQLQRLTNQTQTEDFDFEVEFEEDERDLPEEPDSIEIDFDPADLIEELEPLEDSQEPESDLLILSEDQSVSTVETQESLLIEDKARDFISGGQFAEGKRYILNLIELNPELSQRLTEEFGFLFNLDKTSDDDDKISWKRNAGQVEWRRQVWRILSDRNKFELESLDKDAVKQEEDHSPEMPEIDFNDIEKTSEQLGEELEQMMMELFRSFFNECRGTCDIQSMKERQQPRGPQGGYDLEFICEIEQSRKLKLMIECKNHKKSIKLKDIADKLDAVKADHYLSDIDHWILISPRANPSSELNRILKLWEKTGEYSFNVHIWTPETRVSDFFAIRPDIYDRFFKPPAGEPHPKDWDENKKRENTAFWLRQLEPPLRLPKGWTEYLRNPHKLILQGDSSELETLYHNHVKIKCKDETGTELSQTLEGKVLEWLDKPVETDPSLILLGEYGDGKTVFTYVLARQLAERFLSSPSTGWIPVRFSLKDFGLETVRNSRDFVRRRLEEFGADIDGWNTLKLGKLRILAILDGFDEISKKLDHKTIFRNISELIECYKSEFSGMKLLVTSRKHFFENQQDSERLIQRIGNPQLLHLAPIDRKTTEDHLSQYSVEINSERKFKKLRNYHDPIGLASKPLYLEMVKVSLKELPEENLNELILYETYTRKSLERKDDLLEDDKLETAPLTIIKNMIEILEEIALQLHQSDEEFVYLSDFKGSPELKERLWNMSLADDAAREDETARIAVRSLLRRIDPLEKSQTKKWPVDFCHRSMREYYVARAVCRLIKINLKAAWRFLRNHSLNHEIIFFAGEMMKKDAFNYEESLLRLIHSTITKDNMKKLSMGYVGCNAVNLLYRYKGCLPRTDWFGMILDGADLSEADLSGKNFTGTSLQYANLDNVNFENANFTDCNLTGVRLEETAEIQSIAVAPNRRIYASYSDGVIREWNHERVLTPQSKILFKDKDVKTMDLRLIALPGNSVSILDDRQLKFYDKKSGKLYQKAAFNIKSNFKLIKASPKTLMLLEINGDQNHIRLVDIEQQAVIKTVDTPPAIHYDHLDDKAVITYSENEGLKLMDITPAKRDNLTILTPEDGYVTCLVTYQCKNSPGVYRIAVGQRDGSVQVWLIDTEDWKSDLFFHEQLHDKTVKDIAFIDEERFISGGYDKKLRLLTLKRDGTAKHKPQDLKIAMRCRGMKINGVVREEERALLENLIAKAT